VPVLAVTLDTGLLLGLVAGADARIGLLAARRSKLSAIFVLLLFD
jgi:hypothetical protein